MTCPDDNILVAYVDRVLGETERSTVEGHVDSCPECLTVVCAIVGEREKCASGCPAPPLPSEGAEKDSGARSTRSSGGLR